MLRADTVHRVPDEVSHSITWSVDPRPYGPPAGARTNFRAGRAAAEAFRGGPSYVSIAFPFEAKLTGPLWVHYWGDGQYAGAEMLYTAKNARKWRDRSGRTRGISAGLSSRPIIAKLADAVQWAVSARDATGREIVFERFAMPRWQLAAAEFVRVRGVMDAVEMEFVRTHESIERDGVRCDDHEDPSAL